jgi:cytoskeletal protein CcmA (bactofilin family)
VLVGDLKANKLLIDEGAVFEGTSDMGKKETEAAAEKTVPIPDKSLPLNTGK